jgi:hypothetical protein
VTSTDWVCQLPGFASFAGQTKNPAWFAPCRVYFEIRLFWIGRERPIRLDELSNTRVELCSLIMRVVRPLKF